MEKEWWQTMFDERYLQIYEDRSNQEQTEKEIDCILKALKLKKGAHILDMPCGFGRHSVELAKHGFRVAGIDYSKIFIKKANAVAKKAGVSIDFRQGDMRTVSFQKDTFDAAINMFTSFGYFKNEAEDQKAIDAIAHSLKRGGLFLLDTGNHFRFFIDSAHNGAYNKNTQKWEASSTKLLSNGISLKVRAQYDARNMRWKMKRSWKWKSKQYADQTDVRMYFLPDFERMLSSAGLAIQKVYGDYDLSPFTGISKRLIILAKKTR